MRYRVLIIAAIVLSAAGASFSQAVHTPEKGSAERTAILNALRVPIERDLKQEIVFVTDTFNVGGNWAFIGGSPQSKAGGQPDYSATKYKEAKDADMFDNNFFAVLKRTGTKWKVVTFAIGCTDVCYADWWRRYKAPKTIFPYTE